MPRLAKVPRVVDHFERREPLLRQIYDRLLAVSRKLGPVEEDPKKTSIHLNRVSAFAGVATRKSALIVTIKSETDIRSPRIMNHDRASARRWYLQVRLESVEDVDAEFARWLRKSWELSN
jgi:hypothetical protein